MATLELAPRSGKFSTYGSITSGNGVSACNNMCVLGEDCLTIVGNSSWDNAHTFDPSSKGKRLGREQSILLQRTQHTSGNSNG